MTSVHVSRRSAKRVDGARKKSEVLNSLWHDFGRPKQGSNENFRADFRRHRLAFPVGLALISRNQPLSCLHGFPVSQLFCPFM